ECNGHDDPVRGYHYHVTAGYPYILGAYHGVVETKNFDRGPPPGMGGPPDGMVGPPGAPGRRPPGNRGNGPHGPPGQGPPSGNGKGPPPFGPPPFGPPPEGSSLGAPAR